MSRLRDLAGVNVEGASLAQLAEAAHSVGYRTRALRLSARQLSGECTCAMTNAEMLEKLLGACLGPRSIDLVHVHRREAHVINC